MMSSTVTAQSATGQSGNWRGVSNSEIKSMHGSEVGHASTGRAYSAAVRALKQKGGHGSSITTSSGGGGIIIPKALVKSKKSPNTNGGQMTIQGLLNLKNQNGAGNFRTIQGKSSTSSQSTSKSNVGTLSIVEN